MIEERKQLWLAALEGGEYRQERGRLRRNNAFCCLGVACDVYVKHAENPALTWDPYDNMSTDKGFPHSQGSVLPDEVAEWFGLDEDNPCGDFREVGRKESLASLNDDGLTFKQIAQVIREKL